MDQNTISINVEIVNMIGLIERENEKCQKRKKMDINFLTVAIFFNGIATLVLAIMIWLDRGG